MKPGQDPNELLPVVDRRDRQVSLAPRSQVHAQGLLHRSVHILVFTPYGHLWLQRRSPAKDTHPGKWTSSASGHVDPDESYDQAARRELQEELGLELELEYLGKVEACAATEGEFTAVYRAQTSRRPHPDPREIISIGLFSPKRAQALADDPYQACPSLAAVLALL